MSELEKRSGFDRRTIAYYVQEGLLPKVGRRGRHTRYSEDFLERLMFIRRVRDLQDAGRLRAVTLTEIREVMRDQPPEDLHAAAKKRVPAETLRSLFPDPDLDTTRLAVPAEEIAARDVTELADPRAGGDGAPPRRKGRVAVAGAGGEDRRRLKSLLRRIERAAHREPKAGRARTIERVVRVPVSANIELSVRNLDDEQAKLVEELAQLLNRIGGLG